MRSPEKPTTKQITDPPERMWPLDVSIAALAGLVLYLIVTRLRFDDPRWLFNAWTHAIAVPVIALALAFFSHGFVTRHVQKSIQLGFLFSVFVHLLLLVLAINVVIFSRYFPNAFAGIQPERSAVKRTVPEYLFKRTEETAPTPDWSQPVDAETTSRVIPQEQRQLPPMEYSEPKLELPRPREIETKPLQNFLMKRDRQSESQPQPTDRPSKLARRRSTTDAAQAILSRSPRAPDVPAESEPTESITPRQDSPRRYADQSSVVLSAPQPSLQTDSEPTERSLAETRNQPQSMPRLGEMGRQRQRRTPAAPPQLRPAGSLPSPPQTVALAREEVQADRMISPKGITNLQRGQVSSATMAIGDLPDLGVPSARAEPSAADLPQREPAARSGLPTVTAGQTSRSRGRTGQQVAAGRLMPAGMPSTGSVGDAITEETNASADAIASDRVAVRPLNPRPFRRADASAELGQSVNAPGPQIDLPLREGPIGLSTESGLVPGVIPSSTRIENASVDLMRGRRPKREVGGPVVPFGSKVASVESFSRRITRTRGGAPPAPAGMVGPATEEAIESGLAYLANLQNDDGSWSLQGHGSEVLLRSDSAATGLCLLAFQGAGYTHRQHQYADTVSRGLKFLIDNQRTNGDLYRSENPVSDQNVAFYSHGIAALAMCEAFGMTQDEELKPAAQAALDYIVQTQNRERGGWRYTPQVSADTSVTGWMMMALKSGQLSGLEVPSQTYLGIQKWLGLAQLPKRPDRYRYNPFAPDTPSQRHGQRATPTMTSVGMLMRMYSGWRRDNRAMRSAADYLLKYPPQIGTQRSPQRDTYYWYYATQVMFHMGGRPWEQWNRYLNPLLVDSQIKEGPNAGSWDPQRPVPDRWGAHAGRLYVTTMNLLSLEVYYRHLPIYEDTAE